MVGAAVNYYWESTETSGDYTTSTTETLTCTNANDWAVTNAPVSTTSTMAPIYTSGHMQTTKSPGVLSTTFWIIVVLIIVASILVVLTLYMRRRRPKPKTQQQTQKSYLGTF